MMMIVSKKKEEIPDVVARLSGFFSFKLFLYSDFIRMRLNRSLNDDDDSIPEKSLTCYVGSACYLLFLVFKLKC